jgi:hypothetical protein
MRNGATVIAMQARVAAEVALDTVSFLIIERSKQQAEDKQNRKMKVTSKSI